MAKKCVVCGEEASYGIKGTSDYYCEECAKEHFSDISVLEKIHEAELEAAKLKELISSQDEEVHE